MIFDGVLCTVTTCVAFLAAGAWVTGFAASCGLAAVLELGADE
jgi:hypothetical protein